ncbi:MAG: ATP-dependent metallopeptidase FtsH/Yme1/Tma family protein [Bacteroidetes bacterium]|nr:ATP-dependent metallopeptidase FtsH/Yme1/Tma family protein [Bacteroidota bacterium]
MSEDQNIKKENKPNLGMKKPKMSFNFYWIYGIIALVFIGLQFFNWNDSVKETKWDDFEAMLQRHDVEKVIIVNKENAEVYIKKDSLKREVYKGIDKKNTGPHFIFNLGTVDGFKLDLENAQKKIIAKDTLRKTPAQKEQILREFKPLSIEFKNRKEWGGEILGWLIPIAIMVVLWIVIMRRMGGGGGGGQIFNIGKAKAQLFDKDTMVSINFNDVAGLEEAKVEIMEIVEFLKTPKKFTELGGKIPKGALLVGPPGTGKTLLAKAVAGEAKVPFFSLSGSDFVEMFVGVGASRVRDLFKQAKEKAPCIIFIDEIDAIGRARGKNPMNGSNDERENTLNQLLTEMDGFGTNVGVIILAATNRADILDRALLRAGRFDRQIHVELPDLEERKAIFKVHMRPLKLDKTVDFEFLAKQTPGFSGADIANVCNESALIAARKDKPEIQKQDFLDAIDRIVGGLEKRNKIISIDEKKVIAFHEAGHAAVSWLVEHAHPLVKVTIVPRGKALGAAWYLPEERQITTSEQMFDEMVATLGGRASEEVVFGRISTGALNDLEKVTKQAYAMVVYYGLNEKIGNMSYYDSSGSQEYALTKPFSEKTAQVIDEEIHKLIEKAYLRAKTLLTDNKNLLEKLALLLLEKEVIFKEDLEGIFGKRLFDKDVEEAKKEEEQKQASILAQNDNVSTTLDPIAEEKIETEEKPKEE